MTTNARRVGFLTDVSLAGRDPAREHFISSALHLPDNVIGYDAVERLADLCPTHYLLAWA